MAMQQGGFYWNPQAKQAQQFWNGKLGPPGQIMNPAQRGGGGGSPGGGGGSASASSPTKPHFPNFIQNFTQQALDQKKKQGQTVSGPLSVVPSPSSQLPKAPTALQAKVQSTAPSNITPQTNSKVANATATAIQHGADPKSLEAARRYLGSKDYIGYCESFVEQISGSGWKGTSALDAWRNQQDTAVRGTQGIQPGDKLYFNDPNQPYGHTGLYAGNGKMISATDNGIQQSDVMQWLNQTGQKLLGYIPAAIRGLFGGSDQGIQGGQSMVQQPTQQGSIPQVNPQMAQNNPLMQQLSQLQSQLAQRQQQQAAPPVPKVPAGLPQQQAPKQPVLQKKKKKQVPNYPMMYGAIA